MAKMSGRQFDQQMGRLFRRRFGSAHGQPTSAASQQNPDRHTEIADLAAAVAEEHCSRDTVQPSLIADSKGITLSFGHYEDAFDGMLEHRSGRFHIYCNLDRAGDIDCPRARFTLAHELGHYYIDEHRCVLAAGRVPAHGSQAEHESALRAEQEADHFAAHLLMPPARFLSVARRARPGLGGVLTLAKHFGTSVTAAAIHAAALEAWPCAVVKWNWQGYAWKHLSTSTFRAYFRSTFESSADLPEDCPTRRALRREAPAPGGFFEAGTVASAWFPRTRPGEWRDILFIEQAIPLGRHGVLTFLYPQSGRYG